MEKAYVDVHVGVSNTNRSEKVLNEPSDDQNRSERSGSEAIAS